MINQRVEGGEIKFDIKRAAFDKLQKLVDNKAVCIVLSTPPEFVDLSEYDFVVRCNDWWAYDEGRCDILFHIGASHKIKPSWMASKTAADAELQMLCLYNDGAESSKMKRVVGFHKVPVCLYDNQTSLHAPLRKHFGVRGSSPSTGLIATYTLCKCLPRKLYVTGGDLYATEPEHAGWARHNPIEHCYWYRRLYKEHKFLSLGPDMWRGVKTWENRDESYLAK